MVGPVVRRSRILCVIILALVVGCCVLIRDESSDLLQREHGSEKQLDVNQQKEWHKIQTILEKCSDDKRKLFECLIETYSGHRSNITADKSPVAVLEKIPESNLPPPDDPELEKRYYRKGTELKYPFNYDAVVYPQTGCDDDTFMLILVQSSPDHADRRQAIRETWGGAAVGRHQWPRENIAQKVKLAFLLGLSDAEQMTQNREESAKYDDIVIANFTDTYKNLTLKSLFGLKFVSQRCRAAKYMLKSDDDMFVNMPLLLRILTKTPLTRSIMGTLKEPTVVRRLGKWKVNKEVFPLNWYPPYESGATYVVTTDIAHELVDTSQYIQRFNNEDAFVLGVLAKIVGVNHVDKYEFRLSLGWVIKTCDFLRNKRIISTNMSPTILRASWGEIISPPNCGYFKQ